MSSVPERGEIDDRYKWDLENIYGSIDEWKKDYSEIEEKIEELKDFKGRTTESGDILLSVLELRDSIMRRVSMLSAFARMRSDEDKRNQEFQSLSSQGRSLSSKASSAASFIEPEIQNTPKEQIDSMVESTDGLELYRHYLDDVLRMKQHTKSIEVEEVLSDLGEVLGSPSDIYNMLTNADMRFPEIEKPSGEKVEITQSNFTKLLRKKDREFRKKVHRSFYEELDNVRNTIGSSLRNSIRGDVKISKIRDYETSREAAMHPPNIPTEVYDILLDTIESNLDVLYNHIELKKEALDLGEVEMWDLYMPLPQKEEPEIPYKEAKRYIVDAVEPLGEDYQSKLEEGLNSRWVDVYENRGKRSGAYSGGTYDTQPYILMNYQKDLSSMYTLAHELGHSLHSELTSENQPYIYSDYKIFIAEIASTVNETLLTHHLINNTEDEKLQRHALNQQLERYRSTLYRQTMFASFEDKIHKMEEKNQPLTPDLLDETYEEFKTKYYKPANIDEHIKKEWMRIPHFYYNYYVYQYATGISAATTITQNILEKGKPEKEKYIEFLKSGSKKYPMELLKITDIDLTKPKPIKKTIQQYKKYIQQYKKLN